MSVWKGDIELTPASDTWVDTVRIDAQVVQVEGNYIQTVRDAEREFGGFDPQTGLTDILWNGWETVWTGTETETRTRDRSETRRTGGFTEQGRGWRLSLIHI